MNERHSGLRAGSAAIDGVGRGPLRTGAAAEVHLTIDHQDANGSSKSETESCKSPPREAPAQLVTAFLHHALAGGAVPVAEVEEKARSAELIGERQTITDSKKFKAAKVALHIRSYRVGFGPGAVWFWELPTPPSAPMPEVLSSPAWSLSPRDIPASTDALRADAEVAIDAPSTRRVPFDWVRGVELLQLRPRPLGIPTHRWQIFIEDCRRFLASPWAERAAELGWGTESVFGSRFERPHEHLGAAGLAWNLCGGEILQIYKDGATIMDPDGRRRNFHRRPDRLMTGLPWN